MTTRTITAADRGCGAPGPGACLDGGDTGRRFDDPDVEEHACALHSCHGGIPHECTCGRTWPVDPDETARASWTRVIEWEQELIRTTLRRGEHVVLVSRHDGSRVPAVVTATPDGTVLHAALAGAPIGTPIHLTHWALERPNDHERHSEAA